MGTVIGVNGSELAAYVVNLEGGLRIRFASDDWDRLHIYRGQRVPIRLPCNPDVWFFLAEEVELPPVTWVVFVQSFRERVR